MSAIERMAITSHLDWNRTTVAIGVLAIAAGAGGVAAISPVVVMVTCLAAVAMVAVTSRSARFAIVVGGGLLVFRGSDQVDAPKSAYLVWVALCTIVAIAGLAAQAKRRDLADLRPLLFMSAGVVGAIALSLVVAIWGGVPLIDWIRDAAPYGLLAVSPFLAWEGARSRLGPHMEAIAVAAGLLASVAFAVEWLGRRGIADLPFATLGFGSGSLSALAFMVATGEILGGRPRRVYWVTVTAAVLTLLLSTGTRSVLVLLVGPLAMVLVQGDRFIKAGRLGGGTLGVGVTLLVFGFLLLQVGMIDVGRLAERVAALTALGANLSADQSFLLRAAQADLASSSFAGSPLVGVGLGFRFDSGVFMGTSSFTLDTGMSLAAKFGLIGLGLLAIAMSGMVVFLRRLNERLPRNVHLSFVGFLAVHIAFLPLGNPFEDKGLALAAAILIAWALASTRPAVTYA